MNAYCQYCLDHPEDELNRSYHDSEYGFPLEEDDQLFERLILEINQAGLSWITILKKAPAFKRAFDGFNVLTVAGYSTEKIETLMSDAGIIRNRQKILATIGNAQGFLKIQQEYGSFDAYIWGFTGGKPLQNHWASLSEIPAKTELSTSISKDLAKRGFRFIGPTIIYAHMQATGMVNDNTLDCFRDSKISQMG